MSVKISIVTGGTRGEHHVCVGCANGIITSGTTESQDQTYCGTMERQIKSKVTACTAFAHRNSREHNYRMFGGDAWSTWTDHQTGQVFIVPPGLAGTRFTEYIAKRRAAMAAEG